MDQKLRTERRKLADLKAAEYNPRKALTPDDAEYQKIRRSIEEFGYVDPIIINEDGTIIGGHQRATVLKDLGYQEVDVVVVALDKQREKALNIALNKITGEWDEVKLKDLLLDLDLGDYDISLTGFEQNDLTELVDKLAIEPEAVDDDFNEDEALEQAEAELLPLKWIADTGSLPEIIPVLIPILTGVSWEMEPLPFWKHLKKKRKDFSGSWSIWLREQRLSSGRKC